MKRAAALISIAPLLLGANAGGQALDGGRPLTLIAPKGLSGWSAPGASSRCLENVSATLIVSQCAGWVRTESPVFGDYAVTFEVRSRAAGARALLGVLGIGSKKGGPEYLIAIPLLGPLPAAYAFPKPFDLLAPSETGRAQAMKPEGEWQAYAVTRNRQGLHVMLNGTQILSSGPMRASDGWFGFSADDGSFELRNVVLRYIIPPPSGSPGIGAVRVPGEMVDGAYRRGPGISLPKLVHEVKPQYSAEALAARIEGAVMIECVVETDGTVDKATVIRSLDDRYGLDEKALETARKWRFKPGTRNGVTVPVWITIQLSFSLRK